MIKPFANKINSKILFIILIAAVLTAAICFLLIPKNKAIAPAAVKNPIINIVKSQPEEKKYIQLLFAGDLMFDRGIRYYAAKNGGNEFIFDQISQLLLNNDLVVVNLEGPITDNKSISSNTVPGSTNNYFFTFDKSVAKTLYDENIKLVSLGNNHILNFGQAGIKSTEKYLDDANVSYFGAPGGARGIIKYISGIRVGFVNYNQFYQDIDSENRETIAEIKKVKENSDILIVFCHWGNEYKTNPTDEQKNLAHQFIDSGADSVIGSHSHVIGSIETYKNKKIYYSLGNFIFDQYFNQDVRKGLTVSVKIDKETKQLDFSEQKIYLQNNGQTILSQ